MGTRLYDFQGGITATWIRAKLEAMIRVDSDFRFEPIRGVNYNKIQVHDRWLTMHDGQHERYMFAYKSSFAINHWGGLPKFHVAECRTKHEFPKYAYASQMPVDVYNTDDRTLYRDQRLEFCRNCNREINYFRAFGQRDKKWEEVVLDIAEKRSKEGYGTDSIRKDGYTRDWQHVSFARRTQEGFKCEKCERILVDNDSEFLEVHHIDGNKLNNRRANLRVLCIDCHSKIDGQHTRNYGVGKNALRLRYYQVRFMS